MLLFLLFAPLIRGVFNEDAVGDPRSSFPRLQHVDEPARCLAERGARYCYGVFALSAPPGHRLMDQLREHSSQRLNFNRTRIYRGLCLSRCGASARNPPAPEELFVSCVSNWTYSRYQLRAAPEHIYYCRGASAKPPLDKGAWAFLIITAVILAANVAGTMYDLRWCKHGGNESGWHQQLLAWSVPRSWRQMWKSPPRKMPVSPGEPRDPAVFDYTDFNLFKATTSIIVIIWHIMLITLNTNIGHGEHLENIVKSPFGAAVLLGMVNVQVFMVTSAVQVSRSVLQLQQQQQITPRRLGLELLRRINRLSPLYLYMVFWGATWWPRIDNDPLGARVMAQEQAACRNNFWAHALFLNNVISPADQCIVPSWSIAVDMQMYVATILVLCWALRRRSSLRALTALLIGSIAFNIINSYATGAKSVLYLTDYLDPLSSHLSKSHLRHIYISPTGALPSALVGIILTVCLHQPSTRDALAKSQVVKVLAHLWPMPGLLCWLATAQYLRSLTQPAAVALVSGLDRTFTVVMICFTIYGLLHDYRSLYRRFLLWRVLEVFSRTGLATLLIHWPIIQHRVATESTLLNLDIGFGNLFAETTIVLIMTLLLAVPCTLLLEIPARTFLDNYLDDIFGIQRNYKKVTRTLDGQLKADENKHTVKSTMTETRYTDMHSKRTHQTHGCQLDEAAYFSDSNIRQRNNNAGL